MLEKLKKFWANPYAAPLTEAVGGIVEYARKPINNFIKGVAYVHDEENYKYDREKKTMIARLWSRADEYKSSFELIAYGGSILGALAFGGAGVLAGAAMMGGAAAQVTAATVLGLAFAGVGTVAGPFIVAGVFAVAGGMVGLGIGMVPGFFKGCGTALKHHKDQKTQTAVAKALPPAQAQDAELTKNLATVLAHFNKLPKEHRAPFVRMMNEKYEQGAAGGQSDKALAGIDAMPAKDR